MKISRRLREQFRFYERKGFRAISIEPSGHHVKVMFEGVPRPFYLTANATDPRSYLNNVADLKKFANSNKERKR
jgi:hypothetical protein